MSVYPNINITETEEKYYKAFDVTENTVLIPMLYVRKFTSPTDPTSIDGSSVSSKLYTNAKDLANDMKIGGGADGVAARYCIIGEIGDSSTHIDPSYVMAYNLLLRGLNVVIKPILFGNVTYWDAGNNNTKISEPAYFEILEDAIINEGALDEFADRNVYNIKFITSGAYPNRGGVYTDSEGLYSITTSLYTTLVELAAARKDAVALIEMRENFSSKQVFIDTVKLFDSASNEEFAAGFFPWCNVNCIVGTQEVAYNMPSSYCYLAAYGNSVKSNANWFAASGVDRGAIPGFNAPLFEVGEDLMRWLQGYTAEGSSTVCKVRINPIMNAGTYGYRIWGNKVYKPNADATYKQMYKDFLNVRVLLCDIKKQVYHAAMRTTFEPNDDVTWLNFKSLANTLLDKMKAGRGIRWYKWYRVEADDRAVIKAKLKVRPIEAVEAFDIEVVLTDQEDNLVTTEEV